MSGTLLIVSSPIGHLDDVSPRARAALEQADVVACEDTRRSGRLLAHLGLEKRLLSMHDHNERRRVPGLLEALEAGETVAVLSDAGTPLVSDPGFLLVREAASRGVRVEAIPGPSAILVALVVAGLPPYPFTFGGFPPPKRGKRKQFLTRFAELGHTLVLFVPPHGLVSTLDDAAEVMGDRPAAVCRELTKLHEEVVRGSLTELREEFASRPSIKGEIVLVVGPAEKVRKRKTADP